MSFDRIQELRGVSFKRDKNNLFDADVLHDKNNYYKLFHSDINHSYIYHGQVENQTANGKGIALFKCQLDGDHYKGEFKNGNMDGIGKYVNRSVFYMGQWKKNMPHGLGTLTSKHNIYIGTWFEGYYHGKGVLISANGDTYEGEWKRGKKHGYGRYTWCNGYSYEGQFWFNIPKTTGLFSDKDGKKYIKGTYAVYDECVIDQNYNRILFCDPLHINKKWLNKLSYKLNGLYKITDKNWNVLEYKFFSNNSYIKKNGKMENLLLEKDKLEKLFNELGDLNILPLGNKYDIRQILKRIGYTIPPELRRRGQEPPVFVCRRSSISI